MLFDHNVDFYTGDINILSISNIKIVNDKEVIETISKTFKKDSKFYINYFNRLVNLEYNMVLPDFVEAYDYLVAYKDMFKKGNNIEMFYVDEKTLKKNETLNHKQAKRLIKSYSKTII